MEVSTSIQNLMLNMNNISHLEPSSPMRKAKLRESATRHRVFWSSVLCSACLCYVWHFFVIVSKAGHFDVGAASSQPEVNLAPSFNETAPFLSFDFTQLPKLQNTSHRTLGAIIPVTGSSISTLRATLLPLIDSSLYISEVALVCAQDVLHSSRITLRTVLSSPEQSNHVEFLLLPWQKDTTEVAAVLHATRKLTTDAILFLPEQGLNGFEHYFRDMISSGLFSLPLGPRGFISDDTPVCLLPLEMIQAVLFLVPPFVVSSSSLHGINVTDTLDTWREFGNAISRDTVGGIVVGSDRAGSEPCSSVSMSIAPSSVMDSSSGNFEVEDLQHGILQADLSLSDGTLALFFPNLDDLRAFSKAACNLQSGGNNLQIFLYEERVHSEELLQRSKLGLEFEECRLSYHTYRQGIASQTVATWLKLLQPQLDIVFSVTEDRAFLDKLLSTILDKHATVVSIPRMDLPYCDWIGSLTLKELLHWHTPQVDISVITNDRPDSLTRLVTSLQNARYFGDTVNLRINTEQDSDTDTMQIVNDLRWEHGPTSVNHRVIHGGLLPAVVESWYPHSNNSYGLILEDDVEVSPLFWAWAKMTLLRYRYGEEGNKSPHLFGISLNQQKNIEMRPEGRQLFNARTIFAAQDLPAYNTPYLSQIPCSWGAIYFPEYWREFHSYLGVRLSEVALTIDQLVVPDIRSNKWTKSWKKYFIELAHLRGYVMLYPNYDHFISLSTNHLEVGSHVKDIPLDVYMRKKELFLVPLMPLPDGNESMLLDLPGRQLPAYSSLPTLDLFGETVSTELLIQRGLARQTALFPSCTNPRSHIPHDIRDLFCLSDHMKDHL